MGQHRWLPEPLATFSSAPSALGPSACEKLLPSLTWGPSTLKPPSCVPDMRPGHQGLSRTPARPQPSCS